MIKIILIRLSEKVRPQDLAKTKKKCLFAKIEFFTCNTK
ncbi:hypothetical protein HMPREF9296_1012 [Prevotella disiens FB035-09AN]|uniref:Uncharacterized protein n=1 Tax=Prevotella disiens FB035-09AN TaxID=866771 RepID=E1KU79_9BACT|nr:hypothetical protein HMPREF9296_1012 [Prevotella disiens FB035-09AN]